MEQHSGHRDRLRERFMTNSLAGFAPHEVLELLLFYAIPRRDTNALAHALIDRFGSFDRVLEAPAEELMQVPGIGRHCAVLLNTVFACFRYYNQSKQRSRFVATSTAAVMEYVQSLYFGETAEVCYLLCFDMRMRLLCCTAVTRGSLNAAAVSVRNVVEIATRSRAHSVILVHNHPGGVAMPSQEDISTTRRIMQALHSIGIPLDDHLIVSDDQVRSLSQAGIIAQMRSELY